MWKVKVQPLQGQLLSSVPVWSCGKVYNPCMERNIPITILSFTPHLSGRKSLTAQEPPCFSLTDDPELHAVQGITPDRLSIQDTVFGYLRHLQLRAATTPNCK